LVSHLITCVLVLILVLIPGSGAVSLIRLLLHNTIHIICARYLQYFVYTSVISFYEMGVCLFSVDVYCSTGFLLFASLFVR